SCRYRRARLRSRGCRSPIGCPDLGTRPAPADPGGEGFRYPAVGRTACPRRATGLRLRGNHRVVARSSAATGGTEAPMRLRDRLFGRVVGHTEKGTFMSVEQSNLKTVQDALGAVDRTVDEAK